MDYYLAAPATDTSGGGIAVAVMAMLAVALIVDYMSIFNAAINDRLAFFMALPAISMGWQGGPIANWTLGWLTNMIAKAQESGNDSLRAAAPNMIVGVLVGIVFIYTIGVLIPPKLGKKVKFMGQIAQFTWKETGHGQLNKPLWACAIILGLLADQPQGFAGDVLRGLINALAFMRVVPLFLFGV